MSKKISLKKLAQLSKKSKVATLPTKGLVIWEKRPREEVPNTLPNKKDKIVDLKGKETIPLKEVKKKATWRFKETPAAVPREGTSINSDAALGPTTSMLGSPSVAKKILERVIPPADKEKVNKLPLDQVVTNFFHIIG